MGGGIRSGAGRKPAEIDLIELEKLCSLNCTDQEIAWWFGVSVRTIESRRKQRQFAELMERGKVKGRVSVRRAQMKLVERGNAAMAIWLGKQLLGQRDVTPIELTGHNGQPVQFSVEAIDAIVARARAQRCQNAKNNKYSR
jgi:hypothetical protein